MTLDYKNNKAGYSAALKQGNKTRL